MLLCAYREFARLFTTNVRENMNIKRALLLTATALSLSSAAFADGFSATLDTPILPTSNFSIRLGLNYSLEISPNLFVGASLNPSLTPGSANAFALSARVGIKYVLLVYKDNSSLVNGYVGAAVNSGILPSPFSIGAEANAGIYAITALGGGFKLYGGLDGKVGYEFTVGILDFNALATAGVFFEPIQNLEWRIQGNAGVLGAAGTSAFYWLAGSSLYYTFVPQFKLGLSVGYGSGGAFLLSLGALFAEKPGTLGIAGNYLP